MKKPTGDFKGFHHAYLGVILFLFGFIALWHINFSLGFICIVLGIYMMIDDGILKHALGFYTPIWRLHDWLWKNLLPYQRLSEFLDGIFWKK